MRWFGPTAPVGVGRDRSVSSAKAGKLLAGRAKAVRGRPPPALQTSNHLAGAKPVPAFFGPGIGSERPWRSGASGARAFLPPSREVRRRLSTGNTGIPGCGSPRAQAARRRKSERRITIVESRHWINLLERNAD